jgi:hypothetical protein
MSPRGLKRWEIDASQWTTVYEGPNLNGASPDERWITRWNNPSIEIRPMSGGDWRPLVSAGKNSQVEFTPDGNWLLYT